MNWAAFGSVVVGTIITIVGIVLGWYVFPNIVEDEIGESVILYNDTDQFGRFETLPIPLDFKVYVFHVTNSKNVNEGSALPNVEEKGPYVYKQSRHKKEISWNEKNRISYHEYFDFEFDEAKSKGSENDVVTVLNPALNGAIQIMDLTGLHFILPILSRTVELTFGSRNIFLDIKVREFLFDGYKICKIDEIYENSSNTEREKADAFLACIGLFVMPTKNIRPSTTDGKKELVFTFLGHKNHKHDGLYTVNSGMGDMHLVGAIEQWENKPYLKNWLGGEESACNKVQGRDATIFEPFLNDKSTVTVFNTDICRTVNLHYATDVEFRDVTARQYELGEEVFQGADKNNQDTFCYCLNVTKGIMQDNGCTKNGMLELFTCYNAPILLSYPHFLWADKQYKEAVTGLRPLIEKHKTFALLEPNTGTPLGGSKRVQFNMFVRDIADEDGNSVIDFLQGYKDRTTLIPILWLDEGFTITDELYAVLYDSYISKTYLITGVTWGVIGLGIGVIVITLIVFVVLRKRAAKQLV